MQLIDKKNVTQKWRQKWRSIGPRRGFADAFLHKPSLYSVKSLSLQQSLPSMIVATFKSTISVTALF
jgi:hypothetical protein